MSSLSLRLDSICSNTVLPPSSVQLQKIFNSLQEVLASIGIETTRYEQSQSQPQSQRAHQQRLLHSSLLLHSVVPLVRRVVGAYAVLINDLGITYKSCGKLRPFFERLAGWLAGCDCICTIESLCCC